MPTFTYPGVYIEELSSGVHSITGVATSIAAFIGWATGAFAFKRLCLHYRPPEKLMR